MKKFIIALFLLFANSAFAEITIRNGKYLLNDVAVDPLVGRSCFKLANQLSYHYKGQGSEHYGLGSARTWVDHNLALGFRICRVFLETAGWSECESGSDINDGKPDSCMFGSEPVDKGMWNVAQLQNGGRPTEVHPTMSKVLRWFFADKIPLASGATAPGGSAKDYAGRQMAYELVIIATLKHDAVSVGQQTHVIRQVLSEMRALQEEYPQANILANVINEANAHSQWTTSEVNMLAVRADRCKHPDGRTEVAKKCSPGFEPEQWPGGPTHVDGGGQNSYLYSAGTQAGKYRSVWVHPERDRSWKEWPNDQELQLLKDACSGCPVGASESMYYIENEDLDRARQWYRPSGWTANFGDYKAFLEHAIPRVNYFIVHDEKGAQSIANWPRPETKVEKWARNYLGGTDPPPPPTTTLPTTPSIWKVDIDNSRITKIQGNVDSNGVPFLVQGGSEEVVLYSSWTSDAYEGRSVARIYTFIGLDRGDVAEVNIFVYDGPVPIALRDKHKEVMSDYTAWLPHYTQGHKVRGRITVSVVARVNGKQLNTEHPRYGEWTILPHFGIYIVWGELQ